ncbi:MAG: hypothetical protein M0Q91_01090 [Methanoregula sp.]|jgi:hypothetical protein|nr:hypothetical protein [Methanoregula sp.]
MRRTDREITDLNEIESILNNATVCRIGLANGSEPFIVLVCFGYLKGMIYGSVEFLRAGVNQDRVNNF